MRQLIELDKPLIAAVDGPAFGAGFSPALMADFVLVSPHARFCMVFAKIGLVPDFGEDGLSGRLFPPRTLPVGLSHTHPLGCWARHRPLNTEH